MRRKRANVRTLTDEEFQSLRESINNAIHELVFAAKHLEEDQIEDAANCLMTAQGTIESVAEQVAGRES